MTKNIVKMRSSIILLCALLIVSCSKEKKLEDNGCTSIYFNDTYTQDIENYLSIDTVIRLETKKESLIGKVFKIIPIDSFFCVVDKDITKSIKFFHYSGKYGYQINQINVSGKQFQIADVDYNTTLKTIGIYDNREKSIYQFSLNGDQVNEVKVGKLCYNFISYSKDNNYLLYCNKLDFSNLKKESNDMFLINKKGKVANAYLPYSPEHYTDGSVKQRINSNHRFALKKINNYIYISEFYNDTIFEFNNAKLTPKYSLSYSKPIPNSLKKLPARELIPKVQNKNYNYGGHLFYEDSMSAYFSIIKNLQEGSVEYYRFNKKSLQTELLINNDFFSYPYYVKENKVYCIWFPYRLSNEKKELYNVKANDNPLIVIYSIL